MSEKTSLQKLNEIFSLELSQVPDEIECRLLGPYFKKELDGLMSEINQLRQIVDDIVTSMPDNNERLRQTLMQLANRRQQLVQSEDRLRVTTEVLKEFGFTNILPIITTPPTP